MNVVLVSVDDASVTKYAKNMIVAAGVLRTSPNNMYKHWKDGTPCKGWRIEYTPPTKKRIAPVTLVSKDEPNVTRTFQTTTAAINELNVQPCIFHNARKTGKAIKGWLIIDAPLPVASKQWSGDTKAVAFGNTANVSMPCEQLKEHVGVASSTDEEQREPPNTCTGAKPTGQVNLAQIVPLTVPTDDPTAEHTGNGEPSAVCKFYESVRISMDKDKARLQSNTTTVTARVPHGAHDGRIATDFGPDQAKVSMSSPKGAGLTPGPVPKAFANASFAASRLATCNNEAQPSLPQCSATPITTGAKCAAATKHATVTATSIIDQDGGTRSGSNPGERNKHALTSDWYAFSAASKRLRDVLGDKRGSNDQDKTGSPHTGRSTHSIANPVDESLQMLPSSQVKLHHADTQMRLGPTPAPSMQTTHAHSTSAQTKSTAASTALALLSPTTLHGPPPPLALPAGFSQF